MLKTLLNKSDLTYQLFGESFLEAGRTAEGLTAFEKSHQAKPDEGCTSTIWLAWTSSNASRAGAGEAANVLRQALRQPGDRTLSFVFRCADGAQPTTPIARPVGKSPRCGSRQPAAGISWLNAISTSASWTKPSRPTCSCSRSTKARPPVEAYQGLLNIYRQKKDAEKLLPPLGDAVGLAGNLTSLGDAGKTLLADTEICKVLVAAAQRQLTADPAKLGYGGRLAAGLVAIELHDFAAAQILFDAALKAEGAKPPEAFVTWGLALVLGQPVSTTQPRCSSAVWPKRSSKRITPLCIFTWPARSK